MHKKLVLIALVALLACGGLWLAIGGSGRGAAPARSAGSADPASARADELSLAPELAPPTTGGESERAPAAARSDARASARAIDHDSYPTEAARWIEVTVILPAGVPADDAPALLGFAPIEEGEYGDSDLDEISKHLGLDDSFVEELQNSNHWSRRALGPRVRMPFPPDVAEGVLFLQSRWLHLDPVELSLATTTRVTIEPELGAFVTGRCVFPPGATVPAPADITLEFAGRSRAEGLRGFARQDEREPRVGADLGFELRALSPARKYTLAARTQGFVGHFELSFEVRPGERREVELTFRHGATLAGVVRGDGQPIAGAEVGVEGRGRPWVERPHTQSGADGTFVLAGVPEGKLTLAARKEGWRAAEGLEFEVADGQRVEGIELVLAPGQRISGRVLWPDGTPAAKAQVSAWARRQRWLEPLAQVSSAADGAFVLGGLEAGPVEVFARSARANEGERGGATRVDAEATASGDWLALVAEVTPGTSDLVLRLQEPLPVRGIVVDDAGTPVRAFRVHAERAERPENAPENVEQAFESADGTFALALGLAGEWSFRAAADDQQGEPVVASLPQGGAELRLVLPRGSSIAGVVLDPLGAPVAGASVSFGASSDVTAFGNFDDSGSSETQSDDEGRFEFESGRLEGFVRATHEDWAASEPLALALTPGEALVEVVLRLRVGARITGEVFDDEGKPDVGQNVTCAGGAMAAMSMGFGAERSVTTDGRGRFVFERVTPGKVTLSAAPSEEELMSRFQENEGDEQAFLALLSEIRSASVEVVDGGEAHVVLGSKPKLPVRVHGLVSAAGAPLAERQVLVMAEGGALLQGMKLARTDGAGRYEIVLDRPGDYVFGVSLDEDMGDTGTQFYVAVPEVPELELDLALPLGRIAGVVLGPDGPLEGVALRLASAEGNLGLEALSQSNRARSATDGAFAFEHLRAGTYALEAGSEFGDEADPRFGQVVVDGLRVEPDRALEGLVLRLAQPGRLSGVVRDATGTAQAGLTIFVRDAAGRAVTTSTCTTDAAGRFTYAGIAPGRVTASARGTRLVSAESAPVEIRSGETSTVELTASEGTFLRVTLLDGDEPVRARLRVSDEAGRRVDDLMSLEDFMGVLNEGFSSRERRVGPLGPGKYSLVATADDGKDARTALRIEAGQGERIVKMRLK